MNSKLISNAKIIKVVSRMALVIGLGAGLSGCDQLREKIAGVIQPKTAQQALEGASQQFSAAQYQKAIEEAQPFAEKPGQWQMPLALLLARSYAMTGNAEQALAYLELAARSGALDRPALMFEPAFDAMRTDLRFVSFVAGMGAGAPATAQPAPAPTPAPAVAAPAAAPGVSVQIGPGGASASTGGVSVRVGP